MISPTRKGLDGARDASGPTGQTLSAGVSMSRERGRTYSETQHHQAVEKRRGRIQWCAYLLKAANQLVRPAVLVLRVED